MPSNELLIADTSTEESTNSTESPAPFPAQETSGAAEHREDGSIESLATPAPPADPDAVRPNEQGDDDEDHIALVFRDGLDVAIEGLEVTVSLPTGGVCTAMTSQFGAITLPLPDAPQGVAKVEVTDQTGAKQAVCTLDLARCKHAVIVRSPKVKLKPSPLRQHQQTPVSAQASHPLGNAQGTPTQPSFSPNTASSRPRNSDNAPPPGGTLKTAPNNSGWWHLNGSLERAWQWLVGSGTVAADRPAPAPKQSSPVIAKAVNTAGHPVTVVAGPECPNKDNLRLGQNNPYRDAILAASKRLRLVPQALCALIECEAAKEEIVVPLLDPVTHKPLKNKKGKPLTKKIGTRWDELSGSPHGNISGMTQFLHSTWLGLALQPGTYLHDQAIANGWVKQETIPKKGKQWVFVLEDGTTTKPENHRDDENVRACLAKRLDHVWAINTAVDYGIENLSILENAKLKISGLPDMDKAKMMYLMHHEGAKAGPKFIKNSLVSSDAEGAALRAKFAQQFRTKNDDGYARADALIEAAGGDVGYAYRKWLSGYIDDKFRDANIYFCSASVSPRDLSVLLEAVGGTKINP